MSVPQEIFIAILITIGISCLGASVSAKTLAKDKTPESSESLELAAGTSEECPPSGCPRPKKKEPPEEGEEKDEEGYEYEETTGKEYQRMYYTFGLCGSYFAKKSKINIKGTVGAFTNIEYRIAKIFGFGFDSYYGWLAGSGTQYLSSFNPGFKIYPMAYKNPKFEPFFFAGGHAFDAVFGDSGVGKVGMGQGGFAGAGARLMPENLPLGFEFFVRASFLYMQRPKAIGGRGLAIPIFGFFGATY